MYRSFSLLTMLVCSSALLGCDNASGPADGDQGAEAPAETAPAVTAPTPSADRGPAPGADSGSADTVSDPPKKVDACALLPADQVAEAIGASTEAINAGADKLTVMGEFVGWCGYEVGSVVRVSFTIAKDDGGADFAKMQKMAAPEGIIRPTDDVGSLPAVHRSTDGTLLWTSEDQLLFAISVRDDKGAPLPTVDVARGLAAGIVERR